MKASNWQLQQTKTSHHDRVAFTAVRPLPSETFIIFCFKFNWKWYRK